MSNRDWDKELAKIDRQLASISDEELARPTAAPPAAPGALPGRAGVSALPSGAPPRATGAPSAGASAPASSGKAKAWAWTKVALAVAAGVGIWISPFPARCGPPLVGLVAAAGATSLLGLWSARATWRHHLGFGHVLALLAVLSGAVLGAREILPRVGYAMPTFDRPDTWSCQADAPATTSPTPTPGSGSPFGGPSATIL